MPRSGQVQLLVVWEKKYKFRPFLGADGVDDPKRFVPFVLEASDHSLFWNISEDLMPIPNFAISRPRECHLR